MKKLIFSVLFIALLTPLFAQDAHDLVNILTMDSTIVIDIRYATADNFMGDTLYSANICLLRKGVAERLVRVHQDLKKMGLGLKIWDGYRPLSVQKKMWEEMPNSSYVANPAYGSNHNRGAAVDVTLVDSLGNELPMPTAFDDFSEKAGSNYQALPKELIENRRLLQGAMVKHGFSVIKSEWWHFNDKNIKSYPVMDIPLEQFVDVKK